MITTIPDLADITKQIGKELVDVESLTTRRGVHARGAGEAEFRAQAQSRRYSRRDGIGSGNIMAAGVVGSRRTIPKSCRVNPAISIARTGINVLDVPRTFDRSEGDVHPKGNPHYNLDPLNGRIIARNIADGLARNFPQHKASFEKNLNGLSGGVGQSDCPMAEHGGAAEGVKIVAYHQRLGIFRQSVRPATDR